MTLHSLNYTGRKKIQDRNIDLMIQESDGLLKVSGSIRFDKALTSQGTVVLEAHRKYERERVVVGPAKEKTDVSVGFRAFAPPQSVLLDVRVVDFAVSDKGRLLASANSFRPKLAEEDAGGRQGLLPFRPAPLGQTLWMLEDAGEQPEVLINDQIEFWRGFARSPKFQQLAMPEITRGICRWLWPRLERAEAGDDPIAAQWAKVFRSFGVDDSDHVTDVDDDFEARDAWIDQVVSAVSERQRFLDRYLQEQEGEM